MEWLALLNKVLEIKLVQWILLFLVVVGIPLLTLKLYWYKYDIAVLKSTAADLGSAIQIQNRAVQEAGKQAETYKENYQQAVKDSTKIAVEGQKTLRDIMSKQLTGSCDDKVKQTVQLLKESI